jgi:exonuclease III
VWDEEKDLVGRVVRAEFKDTVVVATYHPQGGSRNRLWLGKQSGRNEWWDGSGE